MFLLLYKNFVLTYGSFALKRSVCKDCCTNSYNSNRFKNVAFLSLHFTRFTVFVLKFPWLCLENTPPVLEYNGPDWIQWKKLAISLYDSLRNLEYLTLPGDNNLSGCWAKPNFRNKSITLIIICQKNITKWVRHQYKFQLYSIDF